MCQMVSPQFFHVYCILVITSFKKKILLFQVILGMSRPGSWPKYGGCVSSQLIFCSSCQFPMYGDQNVSNGFHSVFSCVLHGLELWLIKSPG